MTNEQSEPSICSIVMKKLKKEKEVSIKDIKDIKNDNNHETFIKHILLYVLFYLTHGLTDKVSCIHDAVLKIKPSQKFTLIAAD